MTMIIVSDTVTPWPFPSVVCLAVAPAAVVPGGELNDPR